MKGLALHSWTTTREDENTDNQTDTGNEVYIGKWSYLNNVTQVKYILIGGAMDDDNANQKKRKFPWKTAYSKMPKTDVEERIGISINAAC